MQLCFTGFGGGGEARPRLELARNISGVGSTVERRSAEDRPEPEDCIVPGATLFAARCGLEQLKIGVVTMSGLAAMAHLQP